MTFSAHSLYSTYIFLLLSKNTQVLWVLDKGHVKTEVKVTKIFVSDVFRSKTSLSLFFLGDKPPRLLKAPGDKDVLKTENPLPLRPLAKPLCQVTKFWHDPIWISNACVRIEIFFYELFFFKFNFQYVCDPTHHTQVYCLIGSPSAAISSPAAAAVVYENAPQPLLFPPIQSVCHSRAAFLCECERLQTQSPLRMRARMRWIFFLFLSLTLKIIYTNSLKFRFVSQPVRACGSQAVHGGFFPSHNHTVWTFLNMWFIMEQLLDSKKWRRAIFLTCFRAYINMCCPLW